MRRKVGLLLAFLFVFTCGAGVMLSSYAEENLLKNPGFEGTDGWNVWGKETWLKDLGSREEKHSGNRSYKVVIKEATPWDSTIAEQIVKDLPEGRFEASAWVMIPQKTPLVNTLVYLELFLVGEDGADLKKFQSSQYNNQAVPLWQKLTVSGTIPPGVKSVKYWLVVAPQKEDCSGTVYFDDASLVITLARKPL